MTNKHRKKSINSTFYSAGFSLLRAKGFSCCLDLSKLQFLIKRDIYEKIQLYFLSSVFDHQKPGSGLDPNPDPDSLEMLDPDSINPDPQL